jgi:mono/diheme cytochrome c family protein
MKRQRIKQFLQDFVFCMFPGQKVVPLVTVLICMLTLTYAADNSWMKKVPEGDRSRTNPFAGHPDAIAAGSRLFSDHCAKCHGSDALGRGKRPNLRSEEVQNAPDGEIFWLLRNGNLRRGMPSWSSLPEPSRWQIIAFLKSLGRKE